MNFIFFVKQKVVRVLPAHFYDYDPDPAKNTVSGSETQKEAVKYSKQDSRI